MAFDAAGSGDPIPQTMRAYNMQGTSTSLLVDASGRLRKHHFGMEDDARLIAGIGQLIAERAMR